MANYPAPDASSYPTGLKRHSDSDLKGHILKQQRQPTSSPRALRNYKNYRYIKPANEPTRRSDEPSYPGLPSRPPQKRLANALIPMHTDTAELPQRRRVIVPSPRYHDVVGLNPRYLPQLVTVPPTPDTPGRPVSVDIEGIEEDETRKHRHHVSPQRDRPVTPVSSENQHQESNESLPRPYSNPTPPSTDPGPIRQTKNSYYSTENVGIRPPPYPINFGFDNPTSPASSGILYRLICIDGDQETFRYSWKPFRGLQRDDREIQERRDLAVLDIVDLVEGDHLANPPRKSQFRHSFSHNDPAEFNIGVDFRVKKIHPTGLRIHSEYLQAVLQSLILYYPGFDVQQSEISFIYPFKELFHYWDDMQQIMREQKNASSSVVIKNPDTGSAVPVACTPMTYEHLSILLDAPPVKDAFEKIVEPELRLYQQGWASYDFLWLLFKPGEIVFTQIRGKLAGFVVMKLVHLPGNNSESPLFDPHPADMWQLLLWNLAYDNRRLRRQSHTVHINRFYGEKSISDLPAFPTRFAEDQEVLRNDLIERGKRYHAIICDEQSHMRYNGTVIAEKPYHYQGEIIIDHQSYKLEVLDSLNLEMPNMSGAEPEDLRGEPLFSKFNDMECSADNELEPAQYLLLPDYVLGFALGKREWAVFDMTFVEDLETDGENPMRYLIIDQDKRDLVEAAAGSPREGTALKPWNTDWTADFIEGKGRGRVLFLHGPPGTGKTMTVECIAKSTRRPLIRLSAADLGTEEVLMENRLMRWLDRATIWGAIVLIDEAEVYLEQRQSGHISRNALVTAFLRTMEYFPGLLFLTSNGIGLFDEAVMSRIHLAIRYDRPSDDQRKEIWRSLFDKLEDDQRLESLERRRGRTPSGLKAQVQEETKPVIIIPQTTRDVTLSKNEYAADMKLNGRDIRNILLSAISVARYETLCNSRSGKRPTQIKVTAEQLERALKNKAEFNNDYKQATGFYPDQMAAEKFMRAEGPSS